MLKNIFSGFGNNAQCQTTDYQSLDSAESGYCEGNDVVIKHIAKETDSYHFRKGM